MFTDDLFQDPFEDFGFIGDEPEPLPPDKPPDIILMEETKPANSLVLHLKAERLERFLYNIGIGYRERRGGYTVRFEGPSYIAFIDVENHSTTVTMRPGAVPRNILELMLEDEDIDRESIIANIEGWLDLIGPVSVYAQPLLEIEEDESLPPLEDVENIPEEIKVLSLIEDCKRAESPMVATPMAMPRFNPVGSKEKLTNSMILYFIDNWWEKPTVRPPSSEEIEKRRQAIEGDKSILMEKPSFLGRIKVRKKISTTDGP